MMLLYLKVQCRFIFCSCFLNLILLKHFCCMYLAVTICDILLIKIRCRTVRLFPHMLFSFRFLRSYCFLSGIVVGVPSTVHLIAFQIYSGTDCNSQVLLLPFLCDTSKLSVKKRMTMYRSPSHRYLVL